MEASTDSQATSSNKMQNEFCTYFLGFLLSQSSGNPSHPIKSDFHLSKHSYCLKVRQQGHNNPSGSGYLQHWRNSRPTTHGWKNGSFHHGYNQATASWNTQIDKKTPVKQANLINVNRSSPHTQPLLRFNRIVDVVRLTPERSISANTLSLLLTKSFSEVPQQQRNHTLGVSSLH